MNYTTIRFALIFSLMFPFLAVETVYAQVFFQESFETNTGWNLSHTFDNGNNKFVKRDDASNFPGLEFILFGQDGDFVIGAENTDANEIGASESGIIVLTIDETDISSRTDLELVVSIACNPNDQSYDDRTSELGDYLDFDVSIDNGAWTSIGAFNSVAGSDQNSPLYFDANNNGNGGEIGEPEVNGSFIDFVMPIAGTGNLIQIRARFKMDESAEEIVFDNVRLRENTEDDFAPTINSIALLDEETIHVFFNESVADNANNTSFFTGISNLTNVELVNNNLEALLTYSSPLEVGMEYNFVIFGPTDIAGNPMSSPYLESFYYNPTTPNLVINEIMYNDPNTADTLEYIEVYNNDTDIIKLGGLRILGAVDCTFPSYDLMPGEYYLIARKPTSATNFYGLDFANYSGSLPNSGGNIIIRNTSNVLIDIVSYATSLPWPLAGDGSGSSIELVDFDNDNNLGNNWVAASNGIGFNEDDPIYGTPGELNSSTLPIIDFSANEYHVNETDGTVEVGLNISASNGNVSTVDLSYDVSSTGSSADVDLSGYETISFGAGLNGVFNFSLPIINDADLEGFEYIVINLSNFSNAAAGFTASTAILINDDEYTAPTLYINELQSANTADVADEFGDYDDWFEIYNPNSFPVDLAGYYVTDDFLNLTKHRIDYGSEATIVAPESWILFWADENGNQGQLHTNFKLSSDGESITIMGPDGTTFIDQKGFPALDTDVSYGRETDGSDTWTTFMNSTPNASNNPDGIESIERLNLFAYPNPSEGLVQWGTAFDVEISDLQGNILAQSEKCLSVDLSDLSPGIYLLSSPKNEFLPVKIILAK